MGTSCIKVLLYPSLVILFLHRQAKRGDLPARSPALRGEGRGEILQEYFEIPLYPPEAVKKSPRIRLPGENRGPGYL
jgi:hypothetical protein